jgi:alpha-beta hydrolase superfamily lysophospholipase
VRQFERPARTASNPKAVLLYLPGTHMNGEVALDDPRYSLPLYLAMNDIDVWTLDYRTHFIPPDASGDALAPMRRWTYDVFASDVDAAAKFILETAGSSKLFVAGFSRGAAYAYLEAADHPERVAGLVILDGFISDRPSRAPPDDAVADDIGGRQLTYEKRRALLEMVIRNPDGPAPLPRFKSARENLIHVVERAGALGGAGGLANPSGGFSDPYVLARVLIGYDRYWPAVQNYGNPFTPARLAALERSRIPVLAFASTNIAPDWAAQVARSARVTGSSDVTVVTLKGWGHLDVICGTRAERQVFEPILAWLRRHHPAADNPSRAAETAPARSALR